MSSINPHFTFQYSQPDEYRFSHDSVFLAHRVFEDIAAKIISTPRHLLDLCAGCGIIGMDLLVHLERGHLPLPKTADFVEVQSIYRAHWVKNVSSLQSLLKKSPAFDFIEQNYAEYRPETRADLIVCNPPYFRPGQGNLSPSEFKNRCRFFLDADFAALLRALEKNLSADGNAYVLLRSLEEHGIVLAEEISRLAPNLEFELQAPVRSTPLYKFRIKTDSASGANS